MASPYQRSNTPADARHSSRLGLFQRFYVLEVLLGLKLTGLRFFANMWRHTLKVVFRSKTARGAVTRDRGCAISRRPEGSRVR